jgi:hypothetical protein
MIWLLALLLGGPGDPARPNAPVVPPSVTRTASPATPEAILAAETRRVRTTNRRMEKLLREGVRRSPTFAGMVTRVQETDVIVYLEPSFGLPPEVAGRILLQTIAGNQRYLRVQVRSTLQGDQMIAVIAHELQHALEVAGDPGVVDDVGLVALYRRIGHNSVGGHSYDTDAARSAGNIVRDELIG